MLVAAFKFTGVEIAFKIKKEEVYSHPDLEVIASNDGRFGQLHGRKTAIWTLMKAMDKSYLLLTYMYLHVCKMRTAKSQQDADLLVIYHQLSLPWNLLVVAINAFISPRQVTVINKRVLKSPLSLRFLDVVNYS